jgi:hypothetical protein
VPAVTAVPVKRVQQRACEQQRKWEELDRVRTMLCPKEVSSDQDETGEYPAGGAVPAARARSGVWVVM